MTTREQTTFCRICEPYCGLIATVEDDRLVGLRPDPDHVASKGFACPKGIAYPGVQNDPERVLHPLERQPDGSFTRVSWDHAMTAITSRLQRIVAEHGGDSVAWYNGNPSAGSYSHAMWSVGFVKALGSKHAYGAGSQDTNSRWAASALLYGSCMAVPVPDLDRTELAVVIGANPTVSHGSMATIPTFAEKLHEIVARGGRVVVVDPRRTETAREFEWFPIAADTDAYLLLSLAHVLLAENLVDRRRAARQATGLGAFEALAADFPPESTATHTGIAAADVRVLARDLATKKSVLYGRLGTCLGTNPTLVNFLLDAVNFLAGNLDVAGGAVFSDSGIPLRAMLAKSGADTYDTWRSRIGNLPEVMGLAPAANMAAEIRTPGKGQIRALFVSAGNPVVSTPGGDRLEGALDELDLMVSFDLYVNETGAHADYVLPGVAMYEREDFPFFGSMHMPVPWVQTTDPVVPAPGEARPEWAVIDELARALGTRALPSAPARLAAKAADLVGHPLTPRNLLDVMIRMSSYGDRFGLRRKGHTFASLAEQSPHGLLIRDHARTGLLEDVIRHRDRKLHLDQSAIRREVRRLIGRTADPDFPLRLIGMREPRSENSWLHNVPKLRAARPRHAVRIHPADADSLGIVNGAPVRLTSPWGSIELPALVTDDIKQGVVAVPHGWGHKGRGQWTLANQEGGASVNDLTSTEPTELDPLSGMSHLNGVRVRAEAVDVPRAAVV